MSCTSLRPMSSAVAWLTNSCRPAGAVSESNVTTLTPWAIAALSAGTMALGSLADTTIASCRCTRPGRSCRRRPRRGAPPTGGAAAKLLVAWCGSFLLAPRERRDGLGRRDGSTTARWLRGGFRGRSSRAQRPRGGAGGAGRDHAADEQQPGHDVEGVVGEVVEDQRVADAAEQEHRGDHAAEGAPAPEDGHAAEQHRGDHGQLQAGAVVGPCAREAQGVDDAARPETAPLSTNRMSFARLTRTPEKNAVSWFAPIANTARPNGVAWSRTANSTASTAYRAIG